jgi:hypothetical protein
VPVIAPWSIWANADCTGPRQKNPMRTTHMKAFIAWPTQNLLLIALLLFNILSDCFHTRTFVLIFVIASSLLTSPRFPGLIDEFSSQDARSASWEEFHP